MLYDVLYNHLREHQTFNIVQLSVCFILSPVSQFNIITFFLFNRISEPKIEVIAV
jgi:hypothetical protein